MGMWEWGNANQWGAQWGRSEECCACDASGSNTMQGRVWKAYKLGQGVWTGFVWIPCGNLDLAR